jgi:hypothetical protein
MKRTVWVLALALASFLLTAGAAEGAFPGQRGKIAFFDYTNPNTGAGEIYTAYEGGPRTQLTQLTRTWEPAWSADGQKISFTVFAGQFLYGEIWTMDADGSNQTRLTTGSDDWRPAWSPDGTQITFMRRSGSFDSAVMKMDADGTNVQELHSGYDPSWSPDGNKIAFSDGPTTTEIWTMAPDGTNLTQVSAHGVGSDYFFEAPDWSPDGRFIAFVNAGFKFTAEGPLFRVRPSGIGQTKISPGGSRYRSPAWSPDGYEVLVDGSVIGSRRDLYGIDAGGTVLRNVMANARQASWQPRVEFSGYPRPRGATPLRVSLVPAFRSCIDPNSQHGEPLAFESCAPPVQESEFLTVGTPEANGRAGRSIGSLEAKALVGDPSMPGDDADVSYSFHMTDVWQREAVDDYAGELRLTAPLRVVDKNNEVGDGATMMDTAISLTIPCAQSADPALGSVCSLTTTADTLAPGTVVEDARAVWALGDVRVFDGGSDGIAADGGNDTLFAVPGLFAP